MSLKDELREWDRLQPAPLVPPKAGYDVTVLHLTKRSLHTNDLLSWTLGPYPEPEAQEVASRIRQGLCAGHSPRGAYEKAKGLVPPKAGCCAPGDRKVWLEPTSSAKNRG